MPTIDSLPSRPPMGQDFGQAFNYNVWGPNTHIELCRVPWNSDYRDIVKFDSENELQAYLSSTATQPITIKKMTYARVGDPIRINLPFNTAYQFNYLKVYNPAQPIDALYYDNNGAQHKADSDRAFYYFITDVKYLAPNTTEIQIQLDVWQTFGFDITFGNCYIERGHIGVANEDAFSNNGRDYLTVPEGLDIGDEYVINKTYKTEVNPDGSASSPACWVMMGIGADITAGAGNVDNPKLVMSGGSSVEHLPQGCDIIFFKTINDFTNVMQGFAEKPWVTETVQFVMAIPPLKGAADFLDKINPSAGSGDAYRLSGLYNPDYDTTVTTDWRNAADDSIPLRYRGLKKFLTHPYTIVELTTYTGQPLILKPELMPGDDITITTIQHVSPPSPRWAFIPKHYNATGTAGADDDGEYLDFATFLTDFPQFTVQNNGYLNYLASNRNQISYQHGSANWDYTRAMKGNEVALNQANAGIQSQLQQFAAGQSARNATTNLQNNMAGANAARNVVAHGVGDVARGNVAGAVGGSLNTVVGAGMHMYQNTAQTAIENTHALANVTASTQATEFVADTNKTYRDYAAKGDYQNTISGINARVRDAKMIQPTVSGQMGGESFILWAHRSWNIFTKIKQVNPGIMAMVGEYWLRYGYAVNRFGEIPASLQVMEKFTYWKLKETYITSWKCPETYRQTIRGIFEKGVTVWSNPSDIGNIDMATNNPLTGITL